METSDQFTLERIVPELCACDDVTGKKTLQLHLERYEFASKHGAPGNWLDCACGVGYGTQYIKQRRGDVNLIVGVDVAWDAIDYARRHYVIEGVLFECVDAFQYRGGPFNTVVSLETIEHVEDPRGLIHHFAHNLLAPDGVLIASVPVTPTIDANPFHKTDFTEASFLRMLRFAALEPFAKLTQYQPFNPVRLLTGKERRTHRLPSRLLTFYLRHPFYLMKRARSILRHGFTNVYLTVACKRAIS